MKLLMLNYEFPPLGGGAGNATYYLLKEYSKHNDIQIDLVTSSINKTKIEQFSDNISIHYLDIGKKDNIHYQSMMKLLNYSIKSYFYSKKLINKNKYDLTHAFFGIPCGFIAWKLGIPYIVSLRGSDVPFYNKRFELLDILFFKKLSKIIWRKAKSVVSNSIGLKELALKSNPHADISIIYNGVNTTEFNCNKKSSNNKITLISTGRLIKRKGYEYLIKALVGLNNFKLILIGNGNIKHHLEKQSRHLGVDVDFLGEVDHSNINKHLTQADIFVLPSLNEGMSNSVLEAMASGLPIITTNVGGSKELVKDNGFIVEKASSQSIKEVLLKYFTNPDLMTTHGENSRKIAESMSWENVAREYKNHYKELVHKLD